MTTSQIVNLIIVVAHFSALALIFEIYIIMNERSQRRRLKRLINALAAIIVAAVVAIISITQTN